MFLPTVQQVAARKVEHLARTHLLLDGVERKIASERGREVLREFLRTLMRDRHLRLLGEELVFAADIVQGSFAFSNDSFGSICINIIGLEWNRLVMYIHIYFQ